MTASQRFMLAIADAVMFGGIDAQHAGKEQVDRVFIPRGQIHGDLDRIRSGRRTAREHGKAVVCLVPCPQHDRGVGQRDRLGVGGIRVCAGLCGGRCRPPLVVSAVAPAMAAASAAAWAWVCTTHR